MSGPAGFPADFLWGVATAAQQIEGAAAEGGRGESIWDVYARQPGAIADGTNPGTACDHFHLWREDVERMRWLGVKAYRFSTAWPRVLPDGERVNAAGLDFYDALVDALLAAGIRPMLTLDHWDLPQALQERGGWTSRATIDAFVAYADAVSRRLGDRVGHWVTHNEPWCVSTLGYAEGHHAPGRKDPAAALRVAHHLLVSHGRAVPVLRRNAPGAQVGLATITPLVEPLTDSAADRDAARQLDGTFNRWFLEPLYHARYPEDVIADRVRLGHLPAGGPDYVERGDLEAAAAPTDFLGINYYSRVVVKARPDGTPEGVRRVPEHELTDMGWEVWPDGLEAMLLRLRDTYAPRAIHVTENGAARPDGPGEAGIVADARRVAYLREHVARARSAIAAGVPLQGYFVWSLMDNFEWGQGFAKRFGLFHVDYSTQRRTPRDSAHWYRAFIAGGTAAPGEAAAHTRRSS